MQNRASHQAVGGTRKSPICGNPKFLTFGLSLKARRAALLGFAGLRGCSSSKRLGLRYAAGAKRYGTFNYTMSTHFDGHVLRGRFSNGATLILGMRDDGHMNVKFERPAADSAPGPSTRSGPARARRPRRGRPASRRASRSASSAAARSPCSSASSRSRHRAVSRRAGEEHGPMRMRRVPHHAAGIDLEVGEGNHILGEFGDHRRSPGRFTMVRKEPCLRCRPLAIPRRPAPALAEQTRDDRRRRAARPAEDRPAPRRAGRCRSCGIRRRRAPDRRFPDRREPAADRRRFRAIPLPFIGLSGQGGNPPASRSECRETGSSPRGRGPP